MNLHEYQAKEILKQYQVPVPPGTPCRTVEEVVQTTTRLLGEGHERVVIKSQIHAGGRGKGTFKNGFQGGVKLCKTVDDAKSIAQNMLGQTLVTKQTGPEGRVVSTLLVTAAEEITKEYYFSILLDRSVSKPLIMASPEGGMDIEEVAAHSPEKIFKLHVDPAFGLQPFQARNLAIQLGFTGKQILQAAQLFLTSFKAWWESDAAMLEINPLCLVKKVDGSLAVAAVDAKISIEDNALYRQPTIAAMRDLNEEAPLEIEASKHSLNYIKLDGNIACLVNGAGLAMATMDIIQFAGGTPANFLDVGGGASKEQVKAAFEIILKDPNVKGILVNIFGGIMQCDIIAQGIIDAARETQLTLPLVVRLEGNNSDKGKALLQESGLSLTSASSLAEAAQKIVASVGSV